MTIFKEFEWCNEYNLDKVEVHLTDNCATIYNSYRIKKKSHMLDVIKWIKKYSKSVNAQSEIVILSEWRVHNLLYWMNIKRDRTMHCDINPKSWVTKTMYIILSVLYFGQ